MSASRMKNTIIALFSFPRTDLEDRWWHRLAKVAVALSMVACVLLSLLIANDTFRPYYIFSFEKDFSSQPGTAKNIEDVKIAYDDSVFLPMAYKYSDIPGAYEYITALEAENSSDYMITEKMRRAGMIDGVFVKDLQYNFKEIYYKVAFVFFVTLFWYLFTVHMIYNTIAYIFAGKKAL
jgi:hypothetical protein